MKTFTLICLAATLMGFAGCATPGITRQPAVLSRAQPIYPYELKRAGVSGAALVEFIVDSEGRVRDPQIIKTNRKEFGWASIEAILKWKFSPGIVDGRAVSTRMQQEFQFDIQDVK